jgi:hypothetical protein
MTRKPGGALVWRDWTLAEARRQEQLELFVQRSTDPRRAEVKRAAVEKRRQKRRAKQPGVAVR